MQAQRRVRKWCFAIGGAALLALVLTLGAKSGSSELGPIRLAGLKAPAETVRFDFNRSGCFSHTRHVLDFRLRPLPQVSMSEMPEQSDGSGSLLARVMPVFPRRVATVTLSSQDVQGLDRLLQYYRGGRPGFCTRYDYIVVSRSVYGWKLQSETYLDFSCRVDLLEDADPRDLKALGQQASPVISLDRLIGTAESAQQRGLQQVAYVPTRRSETAAYRELQYRQEKPLEVTTSMLEARSQEVAEP